jgi:hypothetical protein
MSKPNARGDRGMDSKNRPEDKQPTDAGTRGAHRVGMSDLIWQAVLILTMWMSFPS